MAALISTSALAVPVAVTSYDEPNGDGQSAGGTFNYWDGLYTGAGSTTTDRAALSGGVGALTDGYIEARPWYAVSNNAGTGPYVGWDGQTRGDPTITFHFAPNKVITSVSVYVDNSGVGGVAAPSALTIDGLTYAPTVTAFGPFGSQELTVSGLNLIGLAHTLRPDYRPGYEWDFLSEVTFDGATVVPEPASWAMMLVGFGLIGAALRGFAQTNRRLAALRA